MCLCRKLFHLQKITFKSTGYFLPVLTNSYVKRSCIGAFRNYCSESRPPDNLPKEKTENNPDILAPGWGKYEIFKDENAPLILDVEEERLKSYIQMEVEPEDEFSGINLKRGTTGVFEINELVDVLERENAQNIFVARLPSELNYVDYIVVVSGKSQRHMKAMAEFTRRVFKKKMHASDQIPKIEGEQSKDWIAMDLGNIALHIFSKESRTVYDLESLWSLGSEFDELCNKPEDPLIQLLERHSVYLGDLKPANTLG